MRHTEMSLKYPKSAPTQTELDKFWDKIEGMPFTDEDWRIEANGDMTLTVDEEYLTKLLFDDENDAFEKWGVYEERESDTGAYVVHNLPEQFIGVYTIKGVYDASQRLVDTDERTYFFSDEV